MKQQIKCKRIRVGKNSATGDFCGAGHAASRQNEGISIGNMTYLLEVPAAGTAPVSSQTTADYTFTKYVKIKINIAGTDYYLIADTT